MITRREFSKFFWLQGQPILPWNLLSGRGQREISE